MEAILIVILVMLNGVFAMSELAIVSSRKVRLQQRAEAGSAPARRALALANEPNRFLSTVQIGITLIGILAGAFGGATLGRSLAGFLERYDAITPFHEELAFAIVVAGTTYLSLVLGELVPKRIALAAPERIAMMVAGPMNVLSRITAPIVRLLSLSTEAVLRVIRLEWSEDSPVTEEEITVMLKEGTEAGVFHADEMRLIEGVFQFADRRAGDMMTPRHAIEWVDVHDPAERQLETMASNRHSRLLVCDGGLDAVIGMVEVKELWSRHARGEEFDLNAVLGQPLLVPESMSSLRLLAEFRRTGTHLALVIDEYGAVEGLVTLNDVLEEITGDLEPVRPDRTVQRDDGSWLVDGTVTIEELAELLGIDQEAWWPVPTFRTVAGLIVTRLGHIPRASETVTERDLRLEVMDMDGPRVDKVLVTRAAPN